MMAKYILVQAAGVLSIGLLYPLYVGCRFTYLKGLVAISAPWEGSITALKGKSLISSHRTCIPAVLLRAIIGCL